LWDSLLIFNVILWLFSLGGLIAVQKASGLDFRFFGILFNKHKKNRGLAKYLYCYITDYYIIFVVLASIVRVSFDFGYGFRFISLTLSWDPCMVFIIYLLQWAMRRGDGGICGVVLWVD